MRKERILTEVLENEFASFIDYHSARQFSKNLRKMLIQFLMHERALDAIYLKELLYDLDGLFELLDIIDTERDSGEG